MSLADDPLRAVSDQTYDWWLARLGVGQHNSPPYKGRAVEGPWTVQMEKDIVRGMQMWVAPGPALDEARAALGRVLSVLLDTHRDLRYFQGLHDIAGVMLLTVGEERAWRLLDALCRSWLRPWFDPNNKPILAALEASFALVATEDAELAKRITSARVHPAFAIGWVMTWFSHSNDDLSLAQRIFAFILEGHPLGVVYLCAALTLRGRDKLLAADDEGTMRFFMGWPLAALETAAARAAEFEETARLARRLHSRHGLEEIYKISPGLCNLFPNGDAWSLRGASPAPATEQADKEVKASTTEAESDSTKNAKEEAGLSEAAAAAAKEATEASQSQEEEDREMKKQIEQVSEEKASIGGSWRVGVAAAVAVVSVAVAIALLSRH